jgi:transposase-like protein
VGRRGRKRQLDLETEYWRLLQAGVGTVAACKLLGIGRKTGYRWRAENGGLPPARLAEAARSSRYLPLHERQRIATLRDRGLGVREIARRLGRSPSTISRELRRHLRPHDRGIYDGDLAHARAREGLRRTVQVRRFCCAGTLEERIDAMIARKRALADLVVGDGEGWLTELSTAELRQLFMLSAEAIGE